VKALSLAAFALLALSLSSFAADKKSGPQNGCAASPKAVPMLPTCQKIMDGWDTLKTENVAGFYHRARPCLFRRFATEYNGWQELQTGVQTFLKASRPCALRSMTTRESPRRELAWGYATIKEEDTTTGGKHEMATLRWTVIFEKVGDKWLIAHEHFPCLRRRFAAG